MASEWHNSYGGTIDPLALPVFVGFEAFSSGLTSLSSSHYARWGVRAGKGAIIWCVEGNNTCIVVQSQTQ